MIVGGGFSGTMLTAELGAGAARLAKSDQLGIGLEVDGRSKVMAVPNAWAPGPMTKGKFWEITAVPDIREQMAVADDIAMEL